MSSINYSAFVYYYFWKTTKYIKKSCCFFVLASVTYTKQWKGELKSLSSSPSTDHLINSSAATVVQPYQRQWSYRGMTRGLIWLLAFFLLMLENKEESTQPDCRLTVRRELHLFTFLNYLLWKHVFSEPPVIHECNRAQILLTRPSGKQNFLAVYLTFQHHDSPAPIMQERRVLYAHKFWIQCT